MLTSDAGHELDEDWVKVIRMHAERLATGDSGPYDRYMVTTATGDWVEVTEKVHELARGLGWDGT